MMKFAATMRAASRPARTGHHEQTPELQGDGSRVLVSWLGTLSHSLTSSVAAAVVVAAMFVCTVIVTPSRAAENPDGVAVIIGNQDYLGGLPKVEFAHNDATAMKKFVVERLGFRAGNVIDLTNATQAERLAAFGNERTHEGKL